VRRHPACDGTKIDQCRGLEACATFVLFAVLIKDCVFRGNDSFSARIEPEPWISWQAAFLLSPDSCLLTPLLRFELDQDFDLGLAVECLDQFIHLGVFLLVLEVFGQIGADLIEGGNTRLFPVR